MRDLIVKIIDFYQKNLSRLNGATCRHYPSCSEYSKQSVVKYGVIKGIILSIRRIMRCNQWFPGGYDPA